MRRRRIAAGVAAMLFSALAFGFVASGLPSLQIPAMLANVCAIASVAGAIAGERP